MSQISEDLIEAIWCDSISNEGIKAIANAQGVDVNYTSKHSSFFNTPLKGACGRGDFELIKFFVDKGAKINTEVLYNAIIGKSWCGGEPEVVDYLIEHGATPDNYCLLYAASVGSLPLVNKFIDMGFDVNAVSNNSENALMVACRSGRSFEVIKRLVEAGADVNYRDKDNYTPLRNACIFFESDSDVIKYLKSHGAKMYDSNGNETEKVYF